MLTDSNEDSLLARIERRGEQRRGGHGPPLYLSRPLIKASVRMHTHVHTEIQTTQAHTHTKHKFNVYQVDLRKCITGLCYITYLAILMNLTERIKNKTNCYPLKKNLHGFDFLVSHWKTAGLQVFRKDPRKGV